MIELKNITKRYGKNDNEVLALNDVSLHIDKGEFVAIMGASGSGKSTLLQIIGAMDKASEGEYILDGNSLSAYNERQLCKLRKEKFSFVFQNFALMDKYSAYENIELPLLHTKKSRIERRKLIIEATRKLNVEDQLKKYPKQMSGGQQQRIALARALVNNPSMLIADEPTGNLDPETAWDIMNLLNDINMRGTTVVVATHAKDIVDKMKKRVIHIRKGEIIRDDKKGGYDCEI